MEKVQVSELVDGQELHVFVDYAPYTKEELEKEFDGDVHPVWFEPKSDCGPDRDQDHEPDEKTFVVARSWVLPRESGMRMASRKEMLAFARAFPGLQRRYQIASIVFGIHCAAGIAYPMMTGNEHERRLSCEWLDEYDEFERFTADWYLFVRE